MAIGFASGILVVILIARVHNKENRDLEISELENLNLEKRISPFIQIHQSISEEDSEKKLSGSVNHLKLKIDSFKLRNRFYKD